jgi:hypothetical protein
MFAIGMGQLGAIRKNKKMKMKIGKHSARGLREHCLLWKAERK